MSKYEVVEKFVSINGEGTKAGQLAVFIRFKGCNLNCKYCDTKWANEQEALSQTMTEEEILDYVLSTGVKNVTLTGGEPLLRNDIEKVITVLAENNLNVEIETNGSIYLDKIRKLNKENQPSDPGHEALSAVMAKAILTRLNYTPKFIQLVTWLVAEHMRFAPMLKTGEKTLLRWVRAEATSGKFHNSAELTSAYEQLVEVFLADMGATHARDNHNLMTNGKELGKQVVELAQKHMPIAKSDLVITGHDLLKIVPQNKIKDTFDYLLQRVQSGNLPNEQNALLNAVQKNIKRHKNLD